MNKEISTPRIEEIIDLAKELVMADSIQESAIATMNFRKGVEQALTEAHQAGYADGYKQGKFDAEMDANYIPPLPEGKTLDDVIMEQWNPDKTCTCNGLQTTTDNKCVFCGYIKALQDNK